MDWFSRHGDKLLVGIASFAAALAQAGVVPATTVAAISGGLGILHTVFWPNPPTN